MEAITERYSRMPSRTYTQILVDGRWRTVTASRDYVGGKGYVTTWWMETGTGEAVGYNDRALARKFATGLARTLTEAEYHAWADAESIRVLLDEKRRVGVGVN